MECFLEKKKEAEKKIESKKTSICGELDNWCIGQITFPGVSIFLDFSESRLPSRSREQRNAKNVK